MNAIVRGLQAAVEALHLLGARCAAQATRRYSWDQLRPDRSSRGLAGTVRRETGKRFVPAAFPGPMCLYLCYKQFNSAIATYNGQAQSPEKLALDA
jgi:hypothetical protein